MICELQLTSRARFRKWLFKWAFDIISTRSSYSTIFSFNSRNICCLPNIKASCFCIDLQQSIYNKFINSTGCNPTIHWALLCAVSLNLSNLIISFIIPVLFNKLIRVECMYLSNTTLFDGRDISSTYYIRYNYMFQCLTMAIFWLHMKYLVSSYTRCTA